MCRTVLFLAALWTPDADAGRSWSALPRRDYVGPLEPDAEKHFSRFVSYERSRRLTPSDPQKTLTNHYERGWPSQAFRTAGEGHPTFTTHNAILLIRSHPRNTKDWPTDQVLSGT